MITRMADQLPQRVTALETWRDTHEDNLKRFHGIERDTLNSREELFVSKKDHDSHLKELRKFEDKFKSEGGAFKTWKTSDFAEWRKGVDTWKQDADTKFTKFDGLFKDKLNISQYKSDRDDLDDWRKIIHSKFDSFGTMFKDTVGRKDYNSNKKKFDDVIANLTHNTNTLKDGLVTFIPEISGRVGALENKTNPLFGRLDLIEGRTKVLEGRVNEHDDKIKGFEGEFSELGKSIGDQGKKMDKGFKKIEGILDEIRNTPDDNKPISGPTPTRGKGGKGGGTENQSNNASPGGINAANYGQLSVQHAPTCFRFRQTSNTDNSIYCSCQNQTIFSPSSGSPYQIPPPSSRGGNFGSSFGGSFSGFYIPSPSPNPYAIFPCPYEERHRSKYSELGEGSSNYNHTPSFTLELGRTSGGGLFSKPKKENMMIQMGKGGGGGETGRRKHKGKGSASYVS